MKFMQMTDTDRLIAKSAYQAIDGRDLARMQNLLQDHLDVFQKYYEPSILLLTECLRLAGMSDQLDLVKTLVEFGADINASTDITDREGLIRLLFMHGDDQIEMVKWLLGRGAVINQVWNGRTASSSLLSAARNGALRGSELLVAHGAALNGLSFNGLSALDFAEMHGQNEIADFLRSRGAQPAWQIRGETPPRLPATLIDHLQVIMGKVDLLSLQELIPTGMPIQILRVRRDDEQFLITDGMSAMPMSVPAGAEQTSLRHAEVMIRLPKKWALTPKSLAEPSKRWPIEWLLKIARWPHEQHSWLGPTFVVANGEPPQPLGPGTKLSCLFGKPAGYDFAIWKRPDGETVTIYQLYPIYSEEREIEKKQGWEKLLELFEANNLPLFVDPKRENVAEPEE